MTGQDVLTILDWSRSMQPTAWMRIGNALGLVGAVVVSVGIVLLFVCSFVGSFVEKRRHEKARTA